MKIIYTTLILSIILIIALLIASFIYFEKTGHKNFYYSININGVARGGVEIDEYATERNIIYKSRLYLPYEIGTNKREVRFELDKKTLELNFYEEVRSSNGIKELLYLKREDNNLDFLSIAKSKFAYLEDMKIKKDVLFFDREDIATLIPFIKLYNFKIGGSQSFDAVDYRIDLLPPSRCTITLTSIRDEYIDIDDKKIKTECLVLKAKGIGQAYLWVNKKDHDIVAMELSDKQIYIKKTKNRSKFIVKDYRLKDPSYISQKITFMSGDLELNGLLTRPKKEGVYPAVILSQGEEATNKDNYGMFIDLSDYLAKKGYVVLRLDVNYEVDKPRFKSVSIKDEFDIIQSAINLLGEFRFVDPEKIAIIAHSDANSMLPTFLKDAKKIKAWVMLSPRRLAPLVDTDLENIKKILLDVSQKDAYYNVNLSECQRLTLEIAEKSTKDKKNIMGKKVFLKRIREIAQLEPLKDIKHITIPILVLEGKKDDSYSIKYLQELENYIKENNQEIRTLILFRKLNHYLGDIEKTDLIRNHYKTNKEVLETVTGWLDKHLKSLNAQIKTDTADLTKS